MFNGGLLGFGRMIAGVTGLLGVLLAGCNSDTQHTRVAFANTSINGRAAKLVLDTGSPTSWLFDSSAPRFGLDHPFILTEFGGEPGNALWGHSDPAKLTIGTQSASVPLYIVRKAGRFDGLDFDGAIGWPEVRANILVFDSDHHTVRAVSALPPETAGWIKLKVRQDDTLILETPMADGKSGNLFLDTGDYRGVTLPTQQFLQWNKDHSQARQRPEQWANEIDLGAFTLTDVPLASTDIWSFNSVPKLGMYALSRMDLVVDGIAGIAYVRPRPPPGGPYREAHCPQADSGGANGAAANVDWKVDESVQLRYDNLLFRAGGIKFWRNDLKGAIDDLDRSLTLNSKNTDAHFYRGMVHQNLGEFAGAVADYKQAIESDTGDPPDSHPQMFRDILLRRMGGSAADFSRSAAEWNDGWYKVIGQYASGSLSEVDFLNAAADGDATTIKGKQCRAFYYVGIIHLLNGDVQGAREFLEKCVAVPGAHIFESQCARAELARLNGTAVNGKTSD